MAGFSGLSAHTEPDLVGSPRPIPVWDNPKFPALGVVRATTQGNAGQCKWVWRKLVGCLILCHCQLTTIKILANPARHADSGSELSLRNPRSHQKIQNEKSTGIPRKKSSLPPRKWGSIACSFERMANRKASLGSSIKPNLHEELPSPNRPNVPGDYARLPSSATNNA